MPYELRFKRSALKEWGKLGASVKEQFKKKLGERLRQPRVQSAALYGAPNIYKIKLRASGYRLVYEVDDNIVVVTVIAVGKRDKNEVYEIALARVKPTKQA